MANLSREERIEVYGSEGFTQEPDINANGIYTYSPEATERVAKYMPLDEVIIQNNSNSDIEWLGNGSEERKQVIKSGQIQTFDSSDILPFRAYKVKELSGSAISSGDLTITVRRSGMDADKKARKEELKTPANQVVEKFTGLSLQSILGGGGRGR